MGIGISGFVDHLNSRILNGYYDSNTTTLTIKEIAYDLKAAAPGLSGMIYSVDTLEDLPNPLTNTGRFIFVRSEDSYRHSDGVEWSNVYFNKALTGDLYASGRNTYRQLGIPHDYNYYYFSKVSYSSFPSWKTIGVGNRSSHTLGITAEKTLWAWGRNNYGQLGDGTIIDASSPIVINSEPYWSSCSAGAVNSGISAAIKTDGTLWTWGHNSVGQLGDGTTTSKRSPGTTAGGGTTWLRVSCAGAGSMAAIKTDGTLWTWGVNTSGQLGDGSTSSRLSPVTVSGGGTTWSKVAAGESHVLAIKQDGILWGFGINTSGSLGDNSLTNKSSPVTVVGSSISNEWVSVSCGNNWSAAIKIDGTLWTWGVNGSGQLGDSSITTKSSPVTVSVGGTTWSQVSCGYAHAAAVKTDGTLWTWGQNTNGELGRGISTGAVSVPSSLNSNYYTFNTGWKNVAAGYSNTFVLR